MYFAPTFEWHGSSLVVAHRIHNRQVQRLNPESTQPFVPPQGKNEEQLYSAATTDTSLVSLARNHDNAQ